MTRVLVCGGRHFGRVRATTPAHLVEAERARAAADRRVLATALSPYQADQGAHTIIHGAAVGADACAAAWAARHAVPALAYPADWKKHGRAAGPIRNAQMLSDGRPDLVVAFRGGKGTADMVTRARAAGVQVVEVSA